MERGYSNTSSDGTATVAREMLGQQPGQEASVSTEYVCRNSSLVNMSPASIRIDLSILRRAFRLAERAGKAVCPPFPTIKVNNIRSGSLKKMNSALYWICYLKNYDPSSRSLITQGGEFAAR